VWSPKSDGHTRLSGLSQKDKTAYVMLAEIEAGAGRLSIEGESIYAVDPRVKSGGDAHGCALAESSRPEHALGKMRQPISAASLACSE